MDECKHEWDPETALGKPNFTKNRQMWQGEKVYSFCVKCGARTWLSKKELERNQ